MSKCFNHDIYDLVRTEELSPVGKNKKKNVPSALSPGSRSLNYIASPPPKRSQPSAKKPSAQHKIPVLAEAIDISQIDDDLSDMIPVGRKRKREIHWPYVYVVLGVIFVCLAAVLGTVVLLRVMAVVPVFNADDQTQANAVNVETPPSLVGGDDVFAPTLVLPECSVLVCENGFCNASTCICWGGNEKAMNDSTCPSMYLGFKEAVSQCDSEIAKFVSALVDWSLTSGITLTKSNIAPIIDSLEGLKTTADLIENTWPVRDFFAVRYDNGELEEARQATFNELHSAQKEVLELIAELNVTSDQKMLSKLSMKGANRIRWLIDVLSSSMIAFQSHAHLIGITFRSSPAEMVSHGSSMLLNGTVGMGGLLHMLMPEIPAYNATSHQLFQGALMIQRQMTGNAPPQFLFNTVTLFEETYIKLKDRSLMVSAFILKNSKALIHRMHLTLHRLRIADQVRLIDHRPSSTLNENVYNLAGYENMTAMQSEIIDVADEYMVVLQDAENTLSAVFSVMNATATIGAGYNAGLELALQLSLDRIQEIKVYFRSLHDNLEDMRELFGSPFPHYT